MTKQARRARPREYLRAPDYYPERIPVEVKPLRQFMQAYARDTDGGVLKRPFIAGSLVGGSKTNPAHWMDFDDVNAYIAKLGGLPYMCVTRHDPYILVDFDKCVDPDTGEISSWAMGYLSQLNTYYEVSTSGTGIRAIVKSDAAVQGFKSAQNAKDDGRGVEVYYAGHGCILTGRALTDAPIASDVNAVLEAMRAEVAPRGVVYSSGKYNGPAEHIEQLPIPDRLSDWRQGSYGVMAFVSCPWSGEHTVESGPSEAAVGQVLGDDGKRGGYWFRCMHTHDKSWADFRHYAMPRKRLYSAGRLFAGSDLFGGS
jgi:hypothetical protein